MHRIALLILLAATSSSCHDVDSLGSGSGRSCTGGVIGSDVSFIRAGFCPGTSLSMSFSPTVLPGCTAPTEPWDAMVSTSDGTHDDATQAFHCAPVRLITPLAHDALASYTFPSGGRIFNMIYTAARTDREPICDGRDVTAFATLFVSFPDQKNVEVRVLAGDGTGNPGDDESCADTSVGVPRDLFGVFSLGCD